MVRSMQARFVIGLSAAVVLLGCAADEPTGDRGGGIQQAGGPGGFAGQSGVAGTGVVQAAGMGAGDPSQFGNPTELAPNIMGFSSAEICKEPTVSLVIDGSGSMCEVFGASTRWQALRAALLDTQSGLIYRFQSRAWFALALFDGSVDIALAGTATGGSPTPACAGFGGLGATAAEGCMRLIDVPAQLNNAVAIDRAFPPRELGGSTPTDRALAQVVDQLIAAQDAGLDTEMYPQYIFLATDGQPNDICVGGAGGDGVAQQQNVLANVDRAAARGITTFVISLAGADMALQAHLDQVALHGDPNNPAAVTYNPDTPEALVQTLTMLLGTALGCNLE